MRRKNEDCVVPLEWTISDSKFNQGYFYGVVYGNGVYVVIDYYEGALLSSNDGITWNIQKNNIFLYMNDIAFHDSHFVACGNYGVVMHSYDGINWSKQPSLGDYLLGIAYCNDRFIITGGIWSEGYSGGIIQTSTNGSSWSKVYSEWQKNSLVRTVSYGNNLYVAVGSGYCNCMTSIDTFTWTQRTSGTSNTLYGITYGNGLFVAVGNYDTIVTSTDGITWTNRTSGTKNDHLMSITYGNGLYVAVGDKGNIITSKDGINWNIKEFSCSLRSVTYGNGLYVVVGPGGIILTAPDPYL